MPGNAHTTMKEAEGQRYAVTTEPAGSAVLEAKGLTKVYGAGSKGAATHTALEDFDLRVVEGEFLGIMGPSGSGKTTLLNLLSTIDRPTSGSVLIGGHDPATMNGEQLALFRRRRLGFVFQDFNLLDTLSLRENVLLPLVLDKVAPREMNAALDRVAETLGITNVLDRMPFEVSGGQQQRAAIARAMIHDPALVLGQFVLDIEREIGISVSIGLSYCKFLSKIASDLNKPRGFSVIGEAEALGFLASQPVSIIWGVGKAFAAVLERDGLKTIGQLQTMERGDLLRRYATMGERLYRLSRGEDVRRVTGDRRAKSVSTETTFLADLSRGEDLIPALRALSESVSRRLKKQELAGRTVTLKLKTSDFKTRTRNRALSASTQLAERIFQIGLDMLKHELDGTRFRLLGIGVGDLTDAARADPPDRHRSAARKIRQRDRANRLHFRTLPHRTSGSRELNRREISDQFDVDHAWDGLHRRCDLRR